MERKSWGPVPLKNVVSDLLQQRGHAQLISVVERQEAWRELVESRFRETTVPGRLYRGVLHILVTDSIVMQELSFERATLLRELQRRLPDHAITKLQFRVDANAGEETVD